MTVRDVYEATLVEINKENAQTFTIEEFNYIINKAILAFVNEKYNFYPANQQLSDDLRVLLKNQVYSVADAGATIDSASNTAVTYNPTSSHVLVPANTAAPAPAVIQLSSVKDLKNGDIIRFGNAAELFTVTLGTVTNTITVVPSPLTGADIDVNRDDIVYLQVDSVPLSDSTLSNFPTKARTLDLVFSSSDYLHLVSCRVLWKTKRPAQDTLAYLVFPAKRLTYDMLNAIQNNTYLNPAPNRPYYQVFDNTQNSGLTAYPQTSSEYKAYQNKPLLRVHIGASNEFMEMWSVEFDYLKTPERVTIYDEDIFAVGEDTSQLLEFPDYLSNEFVKRCTAYLLEKVSDPRIQTQPALNQEIPAVPMNMQTAGEPAKQQKAETQQA